MALACFSYLGLNDLDHRLYRQPLRLTWQERLGSSGIWPYARE
jgi:hypothetical protein